MNDQNTPAGPHLATLMNHLSEGGLELFVEEGARLLGPEDSAALLFRMPAVAGKIEMLLREHPRSGEQLRFLAKFFEAEHAGLSEPARNEVAFSLLYATKEMDLLPDHTPAVGYLDDAAVIEIVLWRHEEIFERHCGAHRIDWASLKPQCHN